MTGDRAKLLTRDLAIALCAGLLAGLIAYLAKAHLVLTLSVGAAVCGIIATALSIGRARKRPRLAIRILGAPIWETPNEFLWILVVWVEVRNRTREAIRIVRVEFAYEADGVVTGNEQANDEVARAVAQVANSRQYYPPLSSFTEKIPARGTISGWFAAPVKRDPASGTPRCIITARDEIGSQYKVTIPAQKAHTYWG